MARDKLRERIRREVDRRVSRGYSPDYDDHTRVKLRRSEAKSGQSIRDYAEALGVPYGEAMRRVEVQRWLEVSTLLVADLTEQPKGK